MPKEGYWPYPENHNYPRFCTREEFGIACAIQSGSICGMRPSTHADCLVNWYRRDDPGWGNFNGRLEPEVHKWLLTHSKEVDDRWAELVAAYPELAAIDKEFPFVFQPDTVDERAAYYEARCMDLERENADLRRQLEETNGN